MIVHNTHIYCNDYYYYYQLQLITNKYIYTLLEFLQQKQQNNKELNIYNVYKLKVKKIYYNS
jgi:hypothetical protein